jgi:hypothetical protein
MIKKIFKASTLPIAALLAMAIAGPVLAQEQDPQHPRVNEIQGRIDNQEGRINQGLGKGQITPGQASRDSARDARVERQLQHDEAKHGGHITKREQARLNRELNRNSRAIHRQRNQ